MEHQIAYQTVEEDIWCNEALIFKDRKKVFEFFKNPKKVIDTLGFELYEDSGENLESINYKIHGMSEENDILPSAITFECIYAGEVRIYQMGKGYIIE